MLCSADAMLWHAASFIRVAPLGTGKFNDPACVKLLKLDILTHIANSKNVGEAVEEISEYVTDPDTSVARGAVSAIGKMGVKVPACGTVVVDQLMKFLEVERIA